MGMPTERIYLDEKSGEGRARRLLLGGTAMLALVAAISAAPLNFERMASGEFGVSLAHADSDGGEGGDGGGDGGGEGGSDGGDSDGGDSDGGEGGGDSDGGEGGDDSGSDDSGESGDDSSPDQAPGGTPTDPNAPAVPIVDDDGTPDQGTGDN